MTEEESKKITVLFNDEKKLFYVKGERWRELFDTGFYGTLDLENKRLILAPFEVIYLFERGKIELLEDTTFRKIETLAELIDLGLKIKKDLWEAYLIFSDLKSRGYIVKEGISEDIIFSVYAKGTNPLEDIPKFYVFKLSEGLPILLKNIRRITQQSLANRKKLIIAVIDRQGDITYYNVTSISF